MSLKITVVGLGSGGEDQLTLGIWRKLQSSSHIYVRTAKHPAIQLLQENNLPFQSFDHIYEKNNAFADVYETITDKLIAAVQEHKQEIIYAVPGHPMVAEQTSQLLKQKCPDQGSSCNSLGVKASWIKPFCALVLIPLKGFNCWMAVSPWIIPLTPVSIQ